MAQTEFFDYNISLGMSKDYESACNTILTGASDYLRVLMEAKAPALPKVSKVQSSDKIGSGNETPTGADTRNDYWDTTELTVGEYLNNVIGGGLFHQALGGALTDAAVSGSVGAYDHSFAMASPTGSRSTNVLTRDYIVDVGGISYVFAGVGVNEFGFSLEGGNMPTFTCKMNGTGKYRGKSSALPLVTLPQLDAQQAFNYMNWAGSVVKFTDAVNFGGLYNLGATGRFRGFNCAFQNDLRLGGNERQPEDPYQDTADPTSGAHQARMRFGRRSLQASLVVLLDNQDREFQAMRKNTIMTNLTVTMKGPKIGATSAQHEFEIIIPKFQIMDITPDEMDGDEVLKLDLNILRDSVTGGFCTGRIRNALATSIIDLT